MEYLFKYNQKFGFVLISLISLVFGYWFACQQLYAVVEVPVAYPNHLFCLTILKCYLTFIVLYYFLSLLFSFLSNDEQNAILLAATFLPLMFVFTKLSMFWIALSILVLQLAYVLRRAKIGTFLVDHSIDTAVFFAYFIIHLLMTQRYSPLKWKYSLLVAKGYNSEEIPVVAPIFKGFVLAKQFSFSYLDHAAWAGIVNPPGTLYSPLMQLLTFGLDLPSASYEAFHVLYMSLYFIMFIVGSFSFYIFLKYAAKLQTTIAFIGGILFFFGGGTLLSGAFSSDNGIFLSAQVVTPLALLFISFAFSQNNMLYAAWAGLSLAAQFFLMAPHPEGTIYSCLFYGVYVTGLFIFTKDLSIFRKFILGSFSVFIFLMLSAFYIEPIILDRLQGNMYVFAHTSDGLATNISEFSSFGLLLALFAPVSYILMRRNRIKSVVFSSSLFLALIMCLFVYCTTNVYFSYFLINILHIGIHFEVASRIGVYFYMSCYVITLYGLDLIIKALITNRNIRLMMQGI